MKVPLSDSETVDNRTGGIRVRFWQSFWTDIRDEFLEVKWDALDFLSSAKLYLSFLESRITWFYFYPSLPVLLWR